MTRGSWRGKKVRDRRGWVEPTNLLCDLFGALVEQLQVHGLQLLVLICMGIGQFLLHPLHSLKSGEKTLSGSSL